MGWLHLGRFVNFSARHQQVQRTKAALDDDEAGKYAGGSSIRSSTYDSFGVSTQLFYELELRWSKTRGYPVPSSKINLLESVSLLIWFRRLWIIRPNPIERRVGIRHSPASPPHSDNWNFERSSCIIRLGNKSPTIYFCATKQGTAAL